MKKLFIIAVTAIFLAPSCIDIHTEYDDQVRYDNDKIIEFLYDHNIQATKHQSGFYYKAVSTNSSGSVLKAGDIVEFQYSIALLQNGEIIETNMSPLMTLDGNSGTPGIFAAEYEHATGETIYESSPSYFKLNTYSIVPEGLDYGIKMMRTGETFKFYMPSYLAFGSYRSELFPSYSCFIITIRVLDKLTESEMYNKQMDSVETYMNEHYAGYVKATSGLCFYDSIPGTGPRPFNYDQVVIDFKRKYLDNSLIKSGNNVSLYINGNEAVEGLQEGLKLMKEGGSAVLVMPSSLGFRQSVCVIPEYTRKELVEDRWLNYEVKPYSILKYEVKLKVVN